MINSELLKKNRNKVSTDPSDRKTQELLENHLIQGTPYLIIDSVLKNG
ncbi:hypothetical protein KsCSTR_25390 [Candidatus Kuenenia stuttgartiensis]|uniref:Uncharacterized protein n=1 Tax=Kuenenia stuttgartiensis TaxID=174633 RepID=A0A6G7GQQ6_KUEST|nr:hypothetical protein KsCSTR_25390 [Candidatus Kuenenia stuttgartiensis]